MLSQLSTQAVHLLLHSSHFDLVPIVYKQSNCFVPRFQTWVRIQKLSKFPVEHCSQPAAMRLHPHHLHPPPLAGWQTLLGAPLWEWGAGAPGVLWAETFCKGEDSPSPTSVPEQSSPGCQQCRSCRPSLGRTRPIYLLLTWVFKLSTLPYIYAIFFYYAPNFLKSSFCGSSR